MTKEDSWTTKKKNCSKDTTVTKTVVAVAEE
jgi:hypothetical protein